MDFARWSAFTVHSCSVRQPIIHSGPPARYINHYTLKKEYGNDRRHPEWAGH